MGTLAAGGRTGTLFQLRDPADLELRSERHLASGTPTTALRGGWCAGKPFFALEYADAIWRGYCSATKPHLAAELTRQ